ncbi:MAG: DUF5329 family protein [Phycisphaerales bacterium]|nr:DUF5329 family protein [Phycisphaerales bacterium]
MRPSCLLTCLVLVFAGLGLVAPRASAELTVELKNIPDWIVVPPPPGRNDIIEIGVEGGAVGEIYLAAEESSAHRLMPLRVAEGRYQINLAGASFVEFVRGQPQVSQFTVFVRPAQKPGDKTDALVVASVPVVYDSKLPPPQLDFPWDRVTLTLQQRSSKPIPGSYGNLYIHLADITSGQVLLRVGGMDGSSITETESVREGQAVPFAVGESRYVVTLDKLVNLLIGTDYATLSVRPADAWQQEVIERLIARVESSDAVFIRNDVEYTGKQAADHMRLKMAHAGKPITAVEQFIEEVASESSITGKPYKLRLSDGKVVETRAWLKEQAAAWETVGPKPNEAPK